MIRRVEHTLKFATTAKRQRLDKLNWRAIDHWLEHTEDRHDGKQTEK
jgi:hypothetical protein